MAAWFNAISTTNPNQRQLYKLGSDGSVTMWTANPGLLGLGLDPTDLTSFNGAVWFDGLTTTGDQLFKLGSDGSVTQWTNLGATLTRGSTAPFDLVSFDNAL